MRIAIFATGLTAAPWNSAAGYWRGLLKGLARHGHRITMHNPDGGSANNGEAILPWVRSAPWAPTRDGLMRVIESVHDADVIIKASGLRACDRELEAALPAIRRPNSLVIFWDMEPAATLDAITADAAHPLRGLLPRYDAVLTCGGGLKIMEGYEALGVRLCLPIHPAIDPEHSRPLPPRLPYTADLACFCHRRPSRERRIEELLLVPAMLRPSLRVVLGGVGWESKAVPGNVVCPGPVAFDDLSTADSSPLALLVANAPEAARWGHIPPSRLFEAAGAGACVICDEWPGLDLFLTPGREVLTAASGADVVARLDRLTLPHARALGEAARRRILAHHTYAHRAALLSNVLNGVGTAHAAE